MAVALIGLRVNTLQQDDERSKQTESSYSTGKPLSAMRVGQRTSAFLDRVAEHLNAKGPGSVNALQRELDEFVAEGDYQQSLKDARKAKALERQKIMGGSDGLNDPPEDAKPLKDPVLNHWMSYIGQRVGRTTNTD